MTGERSEAESELLDITDWAASMGLGAKERRVRLAQAVNEVLAEAVRDRYRLLFDASDGVHLQTPSGLLVWICPGYGDGEGFTVIVIDAVGRGYEPDGSSAS